MNRGGIHRFAVSRWRAFSDALQDRNRLRWWSNPILRSQALRRVAGRNPCGPLAVLGPPRTACAQLRKSQSTSDIRQRLTCAAETAKVTPFEPAGCLFGPTYLPRRPEPERPADWQR